MEIIEVDLRWDWEKRLTQALRLRPDVALLVYNDADVLRAAQAQATTRRLPSLPVLKEGRSGWRRWTSGRRGTGLLIWRRRGAPRALKVEIGKDWGARLKPALHLDPDYLVISGPEQACIEEATRYCNAIGVYALGILDCHEEDLDSDITWQDERAVNWLSLWPAACQGGYRT